MTPYERMLACPFCGCLGQSIIAVDDECCMICDENADCYDFEIPKDDAEHMAFVQHLLDEAYSERVMIECSCGAIIYGDDIGDAIGRWNARIERACIGPAEVSQ